MSMERTYKEAMAHDLVFYATSLLDMAMRLQGNHPPLHNNAEFQSLDIMQIEFARKAAQYRKAFVSFGVEQVPDPRSVGKQHWTPDTTVHASEIFLSKGEREAVLSARGNVNLSHRERENLLGMNLAKLYATAPERMAELQSSSDEIAEQILRKRAGYGDNPIATDKPSGIGTYALANGDRYVDGKLVSGPTFDRRKADRDPPEGVGQRRG